MGHEEHDVGKNNNAPTQRELALHTLIAPNYSKENLNFDEEHQKYTFSPLRIERGFL